MKRLEGILLGTQRNAVWEAIDRSEDTNFQQSEFEWSLDYSDMGSVVADMLTHTATGFYFTFMPVHYYCAPGLDSPRDSGQARGFDGPTGSLARFRRWLVDLQREADAQDLWGMLQTQSEASEALASVEGDTPFTKDELKEVRDRLGDIRRFLLETQELDAKQAAVVERRFDHLDHEAAKQGRMSWYQMFLGMVLSLALAKILSVEGMQSLMQFINERFVALPGIGPVR